MMSKTAFATANLIALASAHGFFTSPTPRQAGDALAAACGQQAFYMRSSDAGGNVQGLEQVLTASNGYDASKCNQWLCTGAQFADNSANIQSYTAGQSVPMQFAIKAPHTGTANISIVDTASNSVITQLASYSVFASNAGGDAANETSFSLTIPSDLGDQCSTAGACVIQHYWDAADINQTYESCIDFTVGGSGSSSGSSSSAAAVSSAPAATATSVAVSSSASSAAEASSTLTSLSTAAAVATSAPAVPSAASTGLPTGAGNSTSTRTKKPCTKSATGLPVSSLSAATSLSTQAAAVTSVPSTFITTATATSAVTETAPAATATAATTETAPAATATAAATAAATGTSGGSSSGSTGSGMTVQQLVDAIMALIEKYLGVSADGTPAQKEKRSHARSFF